VWWGNEELRARQLAARGVFASNSLVSLGFRSRRIVINTNKLPIAQAPGSLLELTNPSWKGKVALAYPMFGTTSAHFSALREQWGLLGWEAWCRAMAANKPFVVDGNSTVVKLVSRGEAAVGLTDSDDIIAAQREREPVAALPINAETLLIPNTIAIVAGAPHPAEARALAAYLQSSQVANSLIAAGAIETTNTGSRPHLAPAWPAVIGHLDETTALLKGIFLR
jgi:iron(III) transport system substrate-binding protein